MGVKFITDDDLRAHLRISEVFGDDDFRRNTHIGMASHDEFDHSIIGGKEIGVEFNAYLLASNDAVIKFIMAGHADVGIAPEIIIAKYLADPKMRTQIIVGDEFDSHVELSNLVRKDGPITVKEMDAIIDLLIKSGDVATLKSKLIGGRESTAKK